MDNVCLVFYVFDDLNRFVDGFTLQAKIASDVEKIDFCQFFQQPECEKKFVAVIRLDGYLMSIFSRMIDASEIYSKMVINTLFKYSKSVPAGSDINIKFQLVKPKIEVLDYAWNARLSNLISQRLQLEHAMSWLSTLGGAFSALGDNFESYAKVAAKISVQQFRIALYLGEPPLVARCKLYMALSMIQLGKLSDAKKAIIKQYEIAKKFKDIRLQNMCKGVWAKLQFVYKQKNSIAIKNDGFSVK